VVEEPAAVAEPPLLAELIETAPELSGPIEPAPEVWLSAEQSAGTGQLQEPPTDPLPAATVEPFAAELPDVQVAADAAPAAGLDAMGDLDLGTGSPMFAPVASPASPDRRDSLPELLDLPGAPSTADLPELPDLLDFTGTLETSRPSVRPEDRPELPEAPDFGSYPGSGDPAPEALGADLEPSPPEPISALPSWLSDDDLSAPAAWAAEAQDGLSALVDSAAREEAPLSELQRAQRTVVASAGQDTQPTVTPADTAEPEDAVPEPEDAVPEPEPEDAVPEPEPPVAPIPEPAAAAVSVPRPAQAARFLRQPALARPVSAESVLAGPVLSPVHPAAGSVPVAGSWAGMSYAWRTLDSTTGPRAPRGPGTALFR
jgi:hypothetical protein